MLIASLTLRFTAHPPIGTASPRTPRCARRAAGPLRARDHCAGRRRGGGPRVREVARDLTGTFPRSFQRVRIPVRGGGARGRAGGKVGRPHRARRGARRRPARFRIARHRTPSRSALRITGGRKGQAPARPQGPRRRLGPAPGAAAHAGAAGDRSDMAQGGDENGPPHGEAARMRPTGARRDRGSGRSRASRRRARGRPRAEARRPRRPRPPRARRSRARAYGCSR